MSSLFGALTTAVSGLTSQSAAFGNISDNIANSTTVGYKGTQTNFTDYLTTSTATTNDSGFVVATPDYTNTVQGAISSSTNVTALAISGKGYFTVAQASTDTSSTEAIGAQTEYTRDGTFSMDKNGYLVNDSGYALEGWLPSTTGVTDPTTGLTTYSIDQSAVKPIKVDTSAYPATATSNVTLSANLPATPSSSTATFASSVEVYDAQGTAHSVSLNYTPATDASGNAIANTWNVAVSSPDATSASTSGTATVTFDSSGNLASIAGTIGSAAASDNSTSGTAGSLNLSLDFGDGVQSVAVGLGTLGKSNGLTQFAGTTYTSNSISQNGSAPGAFSSVTTQSNGDIIANYDNGKSKTIAQVPITDFANADGLQKQDGQAYTVTDKSGIGLVQTSGTGGAGVIVTQSTEGSNVDIATEFTNLIVAQRAYSANAKIVTTADDMLQTVLDMKR